MKPDFLLGCGSKAQFVTNLPDLMMLTANPRIFNGETIEAAEAALGID